ncbi:MAG TPA: response regulator transcription factor, partial [Bacteroidales bacterium]|nr:response regulator transcription factor [Bacteroidales bacterium]
LSSNDHFEVIAEAKNGKEFVEMIPAYKPDIVLMDIAMPEMDGIEATRKAREKFTDLKVLALTMFGDEKYYYQMIQTGIKGFVLKSSGISELQKAINEVTKGGSFFSNELLYKLVANLNPKAGKDDTNGQVGDKLSKREIEVLKEIAQGLTNEDISDKLNISTTTVRTHRANLLSKTNCNNTASLVMYAIKNKLIELT